MQRTSMLACAALVTACAPAERATEQPEYAAEAEIREVVTSYYAAFSDRDWDAFADHFWPGATLTTVWMPAGESEERVVATSVPDFVAQAPDGPDSRAIFEEVPLSIEVRSSHGVAQVWARYRARFGDPGDVFEWEGTDAFTLMQHDGAWRIVGLAYVSDP